MNSVSIYYLQSVLYFFQIFQIIQLVQLKILPFKIPILDILNSQYLRIVITYLLQNIHHHRFTILLVTNLLLNTVLKTLFALTSPYIQTRHIHNRHVSADRRILLSHEIIQLLTLCPFLLQSTLFDTLNNTDLLFC